jgi:RNA-directed DNA polymerase
MSSQPTEAARELAAVIAAGPLDAASIMERCHTAMGRKPRWLRTVAKELLAQFGEGTRPRRSRIERFLRTNRSFVLACGKSTVAVSREKRPTPSMCPAVGAPTTWDLPTLATLDDLGRWLNLTVGDLHWLADPHSLESKLPEGPLRNYRYRIVRKRSGSARLIESPKLRLKLIQQQLLRSILDRIPAHDAAHGFRAGRSIRSFVEPHVGREVVLRMDLKDFFPRIKRARVLAIFLTAGYPEAVATLLAGLCTNRAPRSVIRLLASTEQRTSPLRPRRLYEIPHLPQGAPTSPALANLAAYRLDCRLTGLSRVAGAAYTRYADDLVFSGGPDFSRSVERFQIQIGAIALEEGFEVNTRKTRIQRQGVSQRAAGIVLNKHPNLPRPIFDELKAILHNCRAHGPVSQNHDQVPDFRAHLAGRISHASMVNPARGAKLSDMLDRIVWD